MYPRILVLITVFQASLDSYLPYIGGAGALVLTGVAAYYATKPIPETPLMPLDAQSRLLPVSDRSGNHLFIEFHGNSIVVV